MSARLLNLRHVPDDEREELRALLEQAQIDFYETPADRFGLSAGALWVRDAVELQRARALLDDYQSQRARQARAAFDESRASGDIPGVFRALLNRPWHALGLLILVLGVLFALSLPMLSVRG